MAVTQNNVNSESKRMIRQCAAAQKRCAKRDAKNRAKLAEISALEDLLNYEGGVLLEEALDHFLEVRGQRYWQEWEASKPPSSRSGKDILRSHLKDAEKWHFLWQVLQDKRDTDADNALGFWPGTPDTGALGTCYESLAEDANVSFLYAVRAALNQFQEDHQATDEFIADPHNIKYRTPTMLEELALFTGERPKSEELRGWDSLSEEKQERLREITNQIHEATRVEMMRRGVLLNSPGTVQ